MVSLVGSIGRVEVVLRLPEVGKDVLVAPARVPQPLPVVIVSAVSSDIDHVVV